MGEDQWGFAGNHQARDSIKVRAWYYNLFDQCVAVVIAVSNRVEVKNLSVVAPLVPALR